MTYVAPPELESLLVTLSKQIVTAGIHSGKELGLAPITTVLAIMQCSTALLADIDRDSAADALVTYADCLRQDNGTAEMKEAESRFQAATDRLIDIVCSMKQRSMKGHH